MNSEAPERIFIQPRYVNGVMPGGIYHLNPPPANTGIEVQGYVREDLATCTVEERAVIEAAIKFHKALHPSSSASVVAAQKALVADVRTLLIARTRKDT